MGHAFAANFSGVRIHTGAAPDRAASALGARALTHGHDILFRSGEYQPHTQGGDRLLAHELAHVVQQAGGLPRAAIDAGPADPLERAAETAADRATAMEGSGVPEVDAASVSDVSGRRGDGASINSSLRESLAVGDDASQVAVAPIVQRACGPSAIGKRDRCDTSPSLFPLSPSLYPPFGNPYLFKVDCDTMAPGEKDRLRNDVKPGNIVIVHGFASIDGDPEFNKHLSCARAEKAAKFLTNEVGAVVQEMHAYGAMVGPKQLMRSVLVHDVSPAKPHQQANPPPTNVCGPDVDAQLTAVLTDIQQYFRGLSRWHKHRSCQQLEAPFVYSMAWDINELYLPNTDWLRSPGFASTSPPCSLPQANPHQDIEDPSICGNTVRVNGRCNLAGTVNYAAFGIMMSECYDFYYNAPWYAALLWTQEPFFNERALRALIWAYKKLDNDDPGPPTEFAFATFDRGPTGRPSTENRPNCKTPCASKATPPNFTFTWEPYHSR
jgi:hypothetical protein